MIYKWEKKILELVKKGLDRPDIHIQIKVTAQSMWYWYQLIMYYNLYSLLSQLYIYTYTLGFIIRKFESSNNFDNKFEFDRRIPKPSYSNTMNNISELFVSSNQLYRVCHYIYWCTNIFKFCKIWWCKKLTFLMDMFWYD